MNVELPDGTLVRDVPDGTSRADLAAKLKSNGMNVPDAWMASGSPKGPADIPDTPPQPKPPKNEPGKMESLIGGGLEAAGSIVTGTGASAIGNIVGLVRSLTSGKFGTGEGVREGAKASHDFAEKYTYQPRGERGQKALETIGDFVDSSGIAGLNPAVPLGAAAPGALSAAGAGAKRTGGAIARNVGDFAGDLAVDVAEGEGLRLPASQPAMAGVGSAETDVSRMRRERAGSLSVPMSLSKGEATRDFEQQRFERETAKRGKEGRPIREHFADNNEKILKNFDTWVDQTGAEAPSLRATGQIVDEALINKAAKAKKEINKAYEEARATGAMQDFIDTSGLIEFLNKNRPAAVTAPVLKAIEDKLVQLKGADRDGGPLRPMPISINDLEELRIFIGQTAGDTATNQRFGALAKEMIDAATEGAGGELYKKARRLRTAYAREFEDRAIVAKLLDAKKGDRSVALEDVFKHSILDGSLDDVRHLGRVLKTEEGGQKAWAELQGQTVSWIKDQATKRVSRDERGNPIVSAAALDKSIRELDREGKLDYLFGKKNAQTLRDLNDLAKDVFVAVPGTVNTSGTGAIVLEALGDLVTGHWGSASAKIVTGGKKFMESRKTQRRVRDALEDPELRGKSIRELQEAE